MSGLKQSYSYPICQTLAINETIQKDQNNNTIPNSLQTTSLFKEDITKNLYKKNPLVTFMDTASSKTPITHNLVDFIDLKKFHLFYHQIERYFKIDVLIGINTDELAN